MDCIAVISDLILPLGAITLSIIAMVKSTKTNDISQKADFLSGILSQYRTNEMADSIIFLWDKFEDSNKNTENLVQKYIELYKQDKRNAFHLHRRVVSQFFHLVSVYFKNNIIDVSILKQIWTKDDLGIIVKILIPIEKELSLMLGHDDLTKKVELMQNFYNGLD